MKVKELVDREASRNGLGSGPDASPDVGAAPLVDRGRKSKIPKDLVDELADYICGHVTKSLKPVQEAIEKKLIIRALGEASGNQKEAAKILGLKHTTLNYKVRKHNIKIKKTIMADPDLLFKTPGRDSEKS
jgi:DNA-binding protein Fis